MNQIPHSAESRTASLVKPVRRIGFLLIPDFSMIAFTSAIEPLRMANRLSGQAIYEWSVVSLSGEPVHASNGLIFTADLPLANAGKFDLILVCGGEQVERQIDRNLTSSLRRLSQSGNNLGALCTGSQVLAKAGLLEGYRCTIHWEYLASFREAFPKAITSQELFEIDRDRYTCSGGTAPLDLMLTLIRRDHGESLSTAISEEFLCERIRGRHDRQKIPLRLTLGTSQPKLMEAVSLMEANLEEPMSLDELSGAVELSRRQLERLFQKYLSCAPTRYYLDLRLHKATATAVTDRHVGGGRRPRLRLRFRTALQQVLPGLLRQAPPGRDAAEKHPRSGQLARELGTCIEAAFAGREPAPATTCSRTSVRQGMSGRGRRFSLRNDLPRIHDPLRIERLLHGAHQGQGLHRARASGIRSCRNRHRVLPCRCHRDSMARATIRSFTSAASFGSPRACPDPSRNTR